MQVLVLVLSLAFLTLGAEWLVRGAAVVARRAGLSPLFIGLTIVGFGTSAPELASSIVASLHGSSDIAVGNVIGSNVFNIAMILGIVALANPIRVQLRAIRRALWIGVGAGLVPYVSVISAGELQLKAGVMLLLALSVYLSLAYRAGRAERPEENELVDTELTSTLDISRTARGRLRDRLWVNLLLIVLGLSMLVLGSRMFVLAALHLARGMGVPELVIGLTIVAGGTSLPELVTSLVAARRGNPDIAIGNVLGSNIFNLLGILGVSSIVRPQLVSRPLLVLDLPVMLLCMLALFPFSRTGSVISRREGLLLVTVYALYLVAQIRRIN